MSVHQNQYDFRLGADTAIGALLGDEPVGLGIDFISLKVINRNPAPAYTFEDKFDYADEAALGAVWTITETGGATDVVVPGDGTVTVQNTANAVIKYPFTGPTGVYRVYFDIVARTSTATTDFRLRIGTVGSVAAYLDSAIGTMTVTPGVYQEIPFSTLVYLPSSGVVLTLLQTVTAAKGMTFGGIKLVRVDTNFLGNATGLLIYSAPSTKMVWGGDGVLRYAPHNLLLGSQDFTVANWSKTNGTLAADTQIAPDGTLTADTLTATGTNASLSAVPNALLANSINSFSVYAKAGTSSWVRVWITNTIVAQSAWFDLANGVVGSKVAGVASHSIQAVGNGWYRCSVVVATVQTNEGFGMAPANADSSLATTVGHTMHFWGAQQSRYPMHEVGYIPTPSVGGFRYFPPTDHDPKTLSEVYTEPAMSTVGIGTGLPVRKTVMTLGTAFGAYAYQPGEIVRLTDQANPLNWILAKVVSYTPDEYESTVVIDAYEASGVFSAVNWDIIVALGVLCEFARTNLCLQSQNVPSATWTKTGVTVAFLGSGNAPDGTPTINHMMTTAATASMNISVPFTATAAVHTLSIYASKWDLRYLQFFTTGTAGTTGFVNFDLEAGTVGSSAAWTGSIQKLKSNWYRCIAVTDTLGAGASTFNVALVPASTSARNAAFTGNGTDGLFVWGAQIEAGAGASSYIPTSTAALLRAYDNLNMPVPMFAHSDTQNTMVVEAVCNEPTTASRDAVSLGFGAQAYFPMRCAATILTHIYNVTALGILTYENPRIVGNINKIAVATKVNDLAGSMNGGAVLTDTSFPMPVLVPPVLLFLGLANSGAVLSGYIRNFKYLPRRATNDELVRMSVK